MTITERIEYDRIVEMLGATLRENARLREQLKEIASLKCYCDTDCNCMSVSAGIAQSALKGKP